MKRKTPVTKKVATKRAVAAVAKKAVTKKAVTKQSLLKKALAKKVAIKKPASKKVATKKPTSKKVAIKKPTSKKVLTERAEGKQSTDTFSLLSITWDVEPTKEIWERYLDVMEQEIGKIMEEISSSGRAIELDSAMDLIAAGVAEQLLGQPAPLPEAIRTLVGFLFSAESFEDGERHPLHALRLLREELLGTFEE